MIKESVDQSWIEFAQSYLLLARVACQELLDTRENKHSKAVGSDWYMAYAPIDLFIPVVFNIKHGIEVFIKTISILCIGKYNEGHDIKKLFDELKGVIPSNMQPKEDGRGNKIAQEDINNFP